ncbi:MAG TPA: 5'/3'-nucleotidase SurE, partial [Myxococcota bacterium]|nr:5'/3'-nucleotidase SurE [Myxococcota bacterium]
MRRILLTNDDGIHAPGLECLAQAFAGLGEVWVVAPHVERSACGRAVTLNRPLRVQEHGPHRLAVEGTPADCVLLACRHFLGGPPDVVVSGVNQGYNIGEDLDYSGTVAAAAEAALQGVRLALAVSVRFDADGA